MDITRKNINPNIVTSLNKLYAFYLSNRFGIEQISKVLTAFIQESTNIICGNIKNIESC